MTLTLTAEQAAQVIPLLQVGNAVLGRVKFRPFDGDVDRCGEVQIELGSVPEASLPALREAIKTATNQKPKTKRKPRP
jgi:hypothetical protein